MSYRVELTDRAYRDLDRLMNWLAERSPGAEERLLARFQKALIRLESNPFTCGFAFENSEFPDELRHLLFETRKGRVYRALFVVRDDVVKVLTIRAPDEKPIRPDDLAT
jgi:plasmid stabilization system protein ParE